MDPAERRTEPRVRSRGEVLLVTDDSRRIPAAVCDISPGGMSVETTEELSLGLSVNIEIHGLCSAGVVRRCARKNGLYQVGMSLHKPRRLPAEASTPGAGEARHLSMTVTEQQHGRDIFDL